jgi:hypothetical protein
MATLATESGKTIYCFVCNTYFCFEKHRICLLCGMRYPYIEGD